MAEYTQDIAVLFPTILDRVVTLPPPQEFGVRILFQDGGSGIGGGGGGSTTDYSTYETLLDTVRVNKATLDATPSGSTTAYAASLEALEAERDTILAGLKTVVAPAGSTTVPGVLTRFGAFSAPRLVRLYERTSGELVATQFSASSDGVFSFPGVSSGQYFVTAHDFGTGSTSSSIIKDVTI
jgi:hypothetical protein